MISEIYKLQCPLHQCPLSKIGSPEHSSTEHRATNKLLIYHILPYINQIHNMSTHKTNPGNFANRPKEEVREIAAKGGHASHRGSSHTEHETHHERQASTTTTTHHSTNPGNFANRPKEEVREIASKGGKASHSGGFASMDPERQVCMLTFHFL